MSTLEGERLPKFCDQCKGTGKIEVDGPQCKNNPYFEFGDGNLVPARCDAATRGVPWKVRAGSVDVAVAFHDQVISTVVCLRVRDFDGHAITHRLDLK